MPIAGNQRSMAKRAHMVTALATAISINIDWSVPVTSSAPM